MRGYRGNRPVSATPAMGERFIAVFSYLTSGLVGFLWIILSHVTGRSLKSYIKFHAFQSILISLLLYIMYLVAGILLSIVKIIPIIGNLVLAIVFYIGQMPVIFGFSILHFAILVGIAYLALSAFQGKYSYIPWVSDNIKTMI